MNELKATIFTFILFLTVATSILYVFMWMFIGFINWDMAPLDVSEWHPGARAFMSIIWVCIYVYLYNIANQGEN